MPSENIYRAICARPLANEVAAWLSAFHPGVETRIADGNVELLSCGKDEAALETIWACALANERLHQANADERALLIEDLLR